MPDTRVVVYVAQGCHLCEPALAIVREVCGERDEPFAVVAIDGDPALEAVYRELIPVVEVDGVAVFTYFAHADRLRALLDA